MRKDYLPPRLILLQCLSADIIALSHEESVYENGNMGEWDDLD